MKIVFTQHAEQKLETAEAKKFRITKRNITSILKRADLKDSVSDKVMRIVAYLARQHSLCVVYKVKHDIIIVITFFPANKGRYEN